MTCRDEVLDAIDAILRRSGRDRFTVAEVVDEMARRGTEYAESTIRTHVTSRMCANAPHHHGVVYGDLLRVGRATYRLAR
jgi:hypothetical protein